MMFFTSLREWIAQTFLFREYFSKMPLPFSNIYFDTVAFVLILVYVLWRILDALRIARVHRAMKKHGPTVAYGKASGNAPASGNGEGLLKDAASSAQEGQHATEEAGLAEHVAQMDAYFTRMEVILRHIWVYAAAMPPEDIFVDAVVIGNEVREISGTRMPPISGEDYPLLPMDTPAGRDIPAGPSEKASAIAAISGTGDLSAILPVIEETGDIESDFEKLMKALEEAEEQLAALEQSRKEKERRTKENYERLKKEGTP